MKWPALALLVLLIAAGCQSAPSVEGTATPNEGTANSTTDPANTSSQDQTGGGGVGIVSPAAGGLSPVTGSDTVVGGGGVGSAAKSAAKNAAAGASGRSYSTDDQGGE